MDEDDLEFVDSTLLLEAIAQQATVPESSPTSRRADRRFELLTQAAVSIPPLSNATYEVREVSRGGIFLAFKESGQLLKIDSVGIGVGANAEIAFSVLVEGRRQQFSVRARIARVERRGIAFQFLTRNPPQLAALRALFSQSDPEMALSATGTKAIPVVRHRRKVQKPADNSGWQDWELVD